MYQLTVDPIVSTIPAQEASALILIVDDIPKTLITAADVALYEAKDQGRNTFCTKIHTS